MVIIYLAQSVLDWCWINQICFSIDQGLFSTDRISIWRCFKKSFLTCSSYFLKTFQTLVQLFFFDWSNLSQICRFLPQISQRFLSSSACKSLLPLLFQFIHIFHAFSLKFLNSWFLGFLNFGVFLFTFDHWVFVFRWYKHDPHALIWSILWIWKFWNSRAWNFVKLGILFNWT